MDERKWENFNSDCLVNVFRRLDLESKLLAIPFVCKQWNQALLNPLCWQKLVLPVDISCSKLAYHHAAECGGSFNVSGLIKFVVDRSNGCATTLVLPQHTTKEDLIYVADVCPLLKTLSLPLLTDCGDNVSELFVKWKGLEVIELGSCRNVVQIIDKISLHCKYLVGLSVAVAQVNHEVASTMVSKLATIKYLVLNHANLEKEHLKVILLGCKELVVLHVCYCVGFDKDDEEIIKLASRIKDFRCEGSIVDVSDYEDVDYISHDELVYSDYSSD